MTTEPFESFAIVEIMGHRVAAGRVTEQMVAGKPLLRVESLPPEGQDPTVQLYGADAIFCITPCTEDQARRACAIYAPVGPARALMPAIDHDEDWDDIGDQDDEYRREQHEGAVANGFAEGDLTLVDSEP